MACKRKDGLDGLELGVCSVHHMTLSSVHNAFVYGKAIHARDLFDELLKGNLALLIAHDETPRKRRRPTPKVLDAGKVGWVVG